MVLHERHLGQAEREFSIVHMADVELILTITPLVQQVEAQITYGTGILENLEEILEDWELRSTDLTFRTSRWEDLRQIFLAMELLQQTYDQLMGRDSLNPHTLANIMSVPLRIFWWNIRGVRNDDFQNNFEQLRRTHHPDAFFHLETHTSTYESLDIIGDLGFTGVGISPSFGLSGGMWML